MAREIISSSNGVEQILHVDANDEYRGAIELRQDMSAVLREVQRGKEQGTDGKLGLRKLAEVPMSVYLRACAEGWVDDDKAWKKWLNDPDNKAFRVHEGRA